VQTVSYIAGCKCSLDQLHETLHEHICKRWEWSCSRKLQAGLRDLIRGMAAYFNPYCGFVSASI
jgi:hypothetical protein